MILKKLYLDPPIFEPVEFKLGINYIFGAKDTNDAKESLNTIGKSTFLDLINFALGADFGTRNPRLKIAFDKKIINETTVFLDFEIDSVLYTIKRSFKENKKIWISTNKEPYQVFSNSRVKEYLYELIFKRSYTGIQNPVWYRTLISFFIKIQQKKKQNFDDPLLFVKGQSENNLIPLHLFLLGIDNTITLKINELENAIKEAAIAEKEVNKMLEEHGAAIVTDAHINALNVEIESIGKNLSLNQIPEFSGADAEKINSLFAEIKNIESNILFNKNLLLSYTEKILDPVSFNATHIERLYNEVNELLAGNVTKTLTDTIDFQRQLINSRIEFFKEAIEELTQLIAEDELTLKTKRENYNNLAKLSNSSDVYENTKNAYGIFVEKNILLAKLLKEMEMLQGLHERKKSFELEKKIIENNISSFKKDNGRNEFEITRMIKSIYEFLYPERENREFFSFVSSSRSKSKIKLNILHGSDSNSKGKGQASVIIYDLAVLFRAIENNLKMPRFLIHDGLLDGMDKAQFIKLIEFLNYKKEEGYKFQYILTLNEEGTLPQNFGKSDLVNPDTIIKQAILVLKPNKKLLGVF